MKFLRRIIKNWTDLISQDKKLILLNLRSLKRRKRKAQRMLRKSAVDVLQSLEEEIIIIRIQEEEIVVETVVETEGVIINANQQ